MAQQAVSMKMRMKSPLNVVLPYELAVKKPRGRDRRKRRRVSAISGPCPSERWSCQLELRTAALPLGSGFHRSQTPRISRVMAKDDDMRTQP